MNQLENLRIPAGQGRVREAAVNVSVSANQPFRLNVRQAGPFISRIWVQNARGEFQEIAPGPGVTVFQGGPSDATPVRELRFRVDRPAATSPLTELPLRYEIVVDPML